jgi:hypothetical protein
MGPFIRVGPLVINAGAAMGFEREEMGDGSFVVIVAFALKDETYRVTGERAVKLWNELNGICDIKID